MSDITLKPGEQEELTNEQETAFLCFWVVCFSTFISGAAIIVVAWKMGFLAAMAAGLGGLLLGVLPGLLCGLLYNNATNRDLRRKYEAAKSQAEDRAYATRPAGG